MAILHENGAAGMTTGRTIAAAALLVSLPALAFGLLASDDQLIRFFPDDAFYYLEPALNWTRRGIVSFDGVNPTNGFHPLYFLVSAALTLFFSSTGLLRAAFIVNALFLALALGLLLGSNRATRSPAESFAVAGVLALPVFFGFVLLSAGVEASTVVVCAVLLVICYQRALNEDFQSTVWNMWLGIALTLFMFARLDNVLLLPVFVGHLLYRTIPTRSWRATLVILAVPVLCGSAYLLLNYEATGHLQPVSGHVKSRSAMGLHQSWRSATGRSSAAQLIGAAPLLISVWTLGALWVSRSSSRVRLPSPASGAALMSVVNVVFYIYLLLFARNFFRWYFAVPLAGLMVSLVYLYGHYALRAQPVRVSRWLRKPATAGLIVTASVAANAVFLVWAGSRPASTSYQLKIVSEQINRDAGDQAVVGVFDAGVIGHYARGRVVNLDGLANSFDYYDNYLSKGRLSEYFTEQGITHLLVRDGLLTNSAQVAAGQYQTAGFLPDSRVVLRKEDELFRYDVVGQFSVYLFTLNRAGTTVPQDHPLQ